MICRIFSKRKRPLTLRGFTLVELLVAVGILAFFLCGILLTYIQMSFMSDLARDYTLVNNAVQSRMEIVKSTSFANLLALNGTQFNITDSAGLNVIGVGVIEVNAISVLANSALNRVRITASFISRGHIIGEDRNLNGQLNAAQGEDLNGNGRLDSPVELVTLIAQ
jgi:prepilin-type N-terminal cleavage/methylation domain-containing protein